ncbi:MAG: RNA polymerase sigma factor [Leeuwenhoekiella sp.]
MKVISIFNNEMQLIQKASQNNREAQRRLYDRHSPKMLSVCRQYIRDFHEAEEAMCNGFLKVFTHLESFKHEGSFEGWVRKIMVRESISYLRGQNKILFNDNEFEQTETAYNNIDSALEVEEIQRLIDSLPEGYKVVFVMYAIEGYKHSEIAQILSISEGTSKSQLFKARKMLQQKLQESNNYHYGTDEV